MKSKKKRVAKPHGYDDDGAAFWLGPSGIKHYDYNQYLEDIENNIRDQVIG